MSFKRNKLLLSDQVYVKLMGDAVRMVVTEAFVDSLPFDERAVAEQRNTLARYCSNVISTMHPETLISHALESNTNPLQREYLETLRDELSSVVEAATTRIVNSECLGTATTPEIVKQAKFEDDEVDALVKASQKAGIGAVANVVKQKMVDTIREERDSFERSEKLHNEIRDIIRDETKDLKDSLSEDDDEHPEDASADDEAEATVESYVGLILAPTDPRQPVTVFSRLQDICMENLLFSTEDYSGEIPVRTLEKITLESTFPFFDLGSRSIADEISSLKISLESEVEHAELGEEEKVHKIKAISKTSLICTICIMTVLEVLKTMNLVKPDLSMVKDFVDHHTNVQNASDVDIKRIERKIGDATDDIKKSVALGALTASETQVAKESLTSIRNMVENMKVAPNRKGLQANIISRLTKAIECDLQDAERPIRTDSVANRIRETNIANLDHSIKVISRRPDVVTVNICIDSKTPMGEDNSSVVIKVIGLDAAGKQVFEDFFQYGNAKFLGESIAEAIHETVGFCDLGVGHKPVNIYFTDQNYSVPA